MLFRSHSPSKVRVIKHLGEGHEPGTQVDVFEFDVRYDYLATLYLDGVVGTKYDFLGIFGFLLHRNKHSRSKVFCSELAMEYSTVCGTPLLGRIPPYKVSPSMLATSPLLRYVGTTTTRVDNTPMPSGPGMSEDEEVKAAKVTIRPSRKKKKRADTSKIEREK